MADLIRFENVALGYRRNVVLADLNFAVQEGEFFGIVGANGSGKTTILRAMLGILRPLSGRVAFTPGKARNLFNDEPRIVHVDGNGRLVRDEGEGRMPFGYVPQRGFLDEIFPLTAREIVLMGCYGRLGPWRRPGQRERDLTEKSLAQVGIGGLATQRFRNLSGGQKQRVLIARALVAEAKVLVLDEPTDGMDLEGQHAILDLIVKLREQSGVSLIYVTHRLNELANTAQRLMLLHEGKVRIGRVEEILTAAVLREVYGVEAKVEQIDGKRVIVA